jgi:hypothetical protein
MGHAESLKATATTTATAIEAGPSLRFGMTTKHEAQKLNAREKRRGLQRFVPGRFSVRLGGLAEAAGD